MRLINIDTMIMEEYIDCDSAPPYVTLSHRWYSCELSFETFPYCSSTKTQSGDNGYGKVVGLCEAIRVHSAHISQLQSQSESLYPWCSVPRHAWVDTCCIDKRSSSELSEAINSMYKWYARANYCFAYLADVDIPEDCPDTLVSEHIVQSEWFDRGWTLQELLASKLVLFFDQDWNLVAYKGLFSNQLPNDGLGTAINMNKRIAEKCKIRIEILEDPLFTMAASVAEIFSWAASRKTTRTEDKAYCLLGLFSINMPLLYGEGENAFRRLQQEIIGSTDDQTIFAWRCYQYQGLGPFGMLAKSPAAFRLSGSIVTSSTASTASNSAYDAMSPSEFVVTQKGLKITAKAVKIWTADHREHWLVPLQCNDIATTTHYKTLLDDHLGMDEWDRGSHKVYEATLERLIRFRGRWKDEMAEESKLWPMQALVLSVTAGHNIYDREDIREIAPMVLSEDDPDVELKTFFVLL